MEHTLHIALTLTFLDLVVRALAKGQFPSWRLLVLAGVLVSVRYESLFLIAIACLLYLLNRQATAAVALGGAGFEVSVCERARFGRPRHVLYRPQLGR